VNRGWTVLFAVVARAGPAANRGRNGAAGEPGADAASRCWGGAAVRHASWLRGARTTTEVEAVGVTGGARVRLIVTDWSARLAEGGTGRTWTAAITARCCSDGQLGSVVRHRPRPRRRGRSRTRWSRFGFGGLRRDCSRVLGHAAGWGGERLAGWAVGWRGCASRAVLAPFSAIQAGGTADGWLPGGCDSGLSRAAPSCGHDRELAAGREGGLSFFAQTNGDGGFAPGSAALIHLIACDSIRS